jgi:phage/plasmid-like protein (TIGR03299 family)
MSKHVFFRNKPWEGLGKDITGAITLQQALQNADLNFTVEPKQLFIGSGNDAKLVEGFKANVRSDNGALLGIVGNKYHIVQNQDAFNFYDGLVANGVTFETGGVTQDNKKSWLLGKLDGFNILGDNVIPYLMFANSFDGSGSVSINVVMLRQVCSNGMTYIIKDARFNWSIRHTASANDKLEIVDSTLKNSQRYIEAFNAKMELLEQVPISNTTVDGFVEYVFPMPTGNEVTDRQVNNVETLRSNFLNIYNHAEDIDKFRGTAYGLYLGITDMASHYAPLRDTRTFAERRFMDIAKGHEFVNRSQEYLQLVA